MNYILDLILAAVLVLFFLRGWKRGFVMELVDLIGVILSAVLAMIFGGIVADWVYATFMRAQSLQSCPTLHDPVDCSPPGSSIHGILQARILERVAISFSRGSSQPKNCT